MDDLLNLKSGGVPRNLPGTTGCGSEDRVVKSIITSTAASIKAQVLTISNVLNKTIIRRGSSWDEFPLYIQCQKLSPQKEGQSGCLPDERHLQL